MMSEKNATADHRKIVPVDGGSMLFALDICGDAWAYRHYPTRTEIYDCDGETIFILYRTPDAFSEREVCAAIRGYVKGRELGQKEGRSTLQHELRRLLNVLGVIPGEMREGM